MSYEIQATTNPIWIIKIINSLVHDVNASRRVCIGNKFELEFGRQFDITSTNMADVIHTMMDA